MVNDHTNGGIQQNENDPFDLLLTSIPVNTQRTVRFVLTNSNPIDIKIDQYKSTITNGNIQFDHMKLLNGSQTKINIENKKLLSPVRLKIKLKLKEVSFFLKIVIPKQHQAIFLLTIHGTDPPEFYTGSIDIQTNYQVRNDLIDSFR